MYQYSLVNTYRICIFSALVVQFKQTGSELKLATVLCTMLQEFACVLSRIHVITTISKSGSGWEQSTPIAQHTVACSIV